LRSALPGGLRVSLLQKRRRDTALKNNPLKHRARLVVESTLARRASTNSYIFSGDGH
jgi:hypothetical protein